MNLCRKIKKNLRGYFCDALKEEEKTLIQTHIKDCPSCLQEFGRVKTLFDLLSISKKETPHPSTEFWQDFSKDLDKKIVTAAQQQPRISIIEKIRQGLAILFQPAWRPVFAAAFVIALIASSALFLREQRTADIKPQTMILALLDEEIIEDLDILDELDTEQNIASEENNPDDTLYDLEEILDELDRWGQLS